MPTHPRIKICGVRTPDVARAAIDAGADAIGLVFAPKSPRYVEIDAARAIAAVVPPFVELVGVFASAEQATDDLLSRVPLTTLQLHGPPTPAHLATLAPRRVVAAVSFDADTAADGLRTWDAAHADMPHLAGLLVDAPDTTGVGGGAGETFDWSSLRRALDTAQPAVPIVLAGGLSPENVGDAIAAVRPHAVDVSSGVESERGVKDIERIRAFCDAVRAAE